MRNAIAGQIKVRHELNEEWNIDRNIFLPWRGVEPPSPSPTRVAEDDIPRTGGQFNITSTASAYSPHGECASDW